jgi:hypothetical protein
MKKNKRNKFLGLMLAVLMLVSSFSTVAFAAEADDSNGIPEGATVHTIEVTVPAASEETVDSGISTRMWGQQTPTISANATVTTDSFYVTDRYFAYEATVTGSASGSCGITLRYYSGLVSSMGVPVGSTMKNDWLDIGTGTYHFVLTNSSNASINVVLTYYSWA